MRIFVVQFGFVGQGPCLSALPEQWRRFSRVPVSFRPHKVNRAKKNKTDPKLNISSF